MRRAILFVAAVGTVVPVGCQHRHQARPFGESHGAVASTARTPPARLIREENDFQIVDFSEDPHENTWFRKQSLIGPEDPIDVRSFARNDGQLWFTHRAGVAAVRLDSGSIDWYGGEHGIPGEPVGGVRVTPSGDVYVATERGLARFEPGPGRFHRVDDGRTHSTNHRDMEIDGLGRLWMLQIEGTGGLARYDGRDWEYFQAGIAGGLTRDTKGVIWFTGRAKSDSRSTRLFPSTILERGGTILENVDMVPFVDSRNRLFLLDRVGRHVAQFEWPDADEEPRRLQGYEGSAVPDPVRRHLWIAQRESLHNETVETHENPDDRVRWSIPLPACAQAKWYAICPIEDRRVYLGAEAGLYVFDGLQWSKVRQPASHLRSSAPTWPTWPQPYSTDQPLYRYVNARCIDVLPFPTRRVTSGIRYEIVQRERDFWLIEDLPGGQRREYQFQPPFYYEPHVLFIDYEGYVWAAGTHHLYRFDGSEITTLTAKSSENFSNDHVYSFAADPDGDVWIGTAGGLFRFRDGQFIPQDKDIGGVFAIQYDEARDRLIVSSAWNGFYILHRAEWRHFRLPYSNNGNHDQMVRSISVATDGTIWLATNAGAVSFSELDRRWVKYGNEFTNGIIVRADGHVYVDARPRYLLQRLIP